MSPAEFSAIISNQKSGASDVAVENARLTQEYFSIEDLDGTSIAISSFVGVIFDGRFSLQGVSWIGNHLHGVHFKDVALNKAELLDCELDMCSLTNCASARIDLTGTVFRSCRIIKLDLSSACLINVKFIDCDFSDAIFPGDLLVEGKKNINFGRDGRIVASG